MYIDRRVRDTTAIENIGPRSNARHYERANTGSVRFNVYNFSVNTDADSRRDGAHRHGHAHR
jgi:hypothetical protein